MHTSTAEQLEQLLDRQVRPHLALHGGNMKVVELKDGVLRFRLLGQCAGCPSAWLTTEQVIADEITRAIPEIGRVVLVQDAEEELLDEARRRMRGSRDGQAT